MGERHQVPEVRTAVPVEELLDDVGALCKAEVGRLARLSRGAGLTAGDAKALEALARTIKLVHDMDVQLRREHEEDYGKQDEAALRAEQARLQRELGK